ncbi:MAG: 7-cyano-7-deazaguanine synthase QueC [Dehalococcoidia bacterium]|nr:7-cyano-7-deazaguanine synthase QueC [Dehalococcoidia bacterium]
MKNIGVVLLSGGLDSTSVAAMAKRKVDSLFALTINYGQTHLKETVAAAKVARFLGIQHQVVKANFFKTLAWYSALTSTEQFNIPEEAAKPGVLKNRESDIPITYVPLRNTFFITMGAAFLESHALDAIEKDGVKPSGLRTTLWLGPNALDYSGYPDCRPEYYEKISAAINQGSKLFTQYKVKLGIETPLIRMSKAEIVMAGIKYKAPIELTWSCYQGSAKPCGVCDSCVLRAKGFKEAGVKDPAISSSKKTK